MIYLIVNNSYHIIEEEIKKIIDNKEYQVIDYLKSDIETIVNEASYNDLFNNEKIIVVKNASFLGGKDTTELKILEKYLEEPNPLTTLIITYNDSINERKKIVQLIKEKYHYKIIKPLYHKDIVDKLSQRIKSNGYKIKLDDLDYLVNCSLNNYDIAYNEVSKLFLYYNEPTDIKSKDVINIVATVMEDNNFHFVDAVILKDTLSAIKMLEDFKIEKVEVNILISLLAREYRLMLISYTLNKKGYSIKEIRENFDKMFDWQINKALKNSYNYTIKELEDYLIKLTDLDYKIKTGKIEKYLGLELFILSLT